MSLLVTRSDGAYPRRERRDIAPAPPIRRSVFRVLYAQNDRLDGYSSDIELEFVEREVHRDC